MDFFGASRWGRELGLDLFFLAPPFFSSPLPSSSFSRRNDGGTYEGTLEGEGAVTVPWNLHNSGLQKMTAFSVDAQFIPGVLF